MAADEVIQLAWDDQAVQLMQPSAQASPWSMVEGFTDNLRNAHLWELRTGRMHALVAVRGLQCEGGRLLEVVGLRSLGARLTPEGVALVERLARDAYAADLLSMCTRWPHLVRTCVRAGWSDVAHVVNKPLMVTQ